MRAVHCFRIAFATSAILPVALWAADPQAARFYEDALKRFESRDTAGAIIQLKNAIQKDRTMLAAQVLLGKALLSNGDPIGAEVAFEEALQQGVDRSEVILGLGQAMLIQGKFDALLLRLEPAGLADDLRLEVLLMRGKALTEKGNLLQADREFQAAAALAPRSPRVRAAQGGLALRQQRPADAERLAAEALALGRDEPAVWELKASILHVKGDFDGAIAAYERLLQLVPNNVEARVARAGLQIDRNRIDDATADVNEILRAFPRDPRGAYLKALIAARRGDTVTVQDSLKSIVNLLDPVPADVIGINRQMLFLHGLAHFSLGNQEKAVTILAEYLRRYPGDPGAAKLLAGLYLQKGDSNKVINLLEPLRAKGVRDPKLYSLLAGAYMTERRYQQASRLLEDAVNLSGGAADLRAELGFSLIGEGRSDLGLDYLQQAFASDPKQVRTGIALATLLMRRGQADKALAVATSLEKRQPKDVAVLNVLGGIKGASGDLVGARSAYERILKLAPTHAPAILNLARLDVGEGKTDAARLRLAALLKTSPNNLDAMMEMGMLEQQAGNISEAVGWLEKARAFPAGAVRAGLQLAELHLAQRNHQPALDVSRDVVLKSGRSLQSLALLARVQISAGDKSEARKTLTEMTRLANFDAEAQYSVARLQRAAGNDAGAYYSLEKGLSGTPEHLPSQIMKIEVDIARGEFAKAETALKLLLGQRPNDIAVARLQGDLAMARGQYPLAIATYRNLAGSKGGEGVILPLYRAYEKAGERTNGLRALENWSKTRPNEPTVLRVLGDGYLAAGDLPNARRTYERLLAVRPDDPLVLNNLAQTLLRQGDGGALAAAEKAHKLAGRDPIVTDTLGWVLVSQGQVERGLSYLRDARLRDPANREIRYHLAHALARSGRLVEAREELAAALRGGESFDGKDEALSLQRDLQR
ncbi:MAG: PEP-CTERM system TPR-repeat protein PrsT [Dechloromonas sp.]|nr:MAG: PEP-CTERM system TPR-repeat protein PrsT [Dechloromonas sp.]